MKMNKIKGKIYSDNICMNFKASTLLDIMHFTTWKKSVFRVAGSKINLSTCLIGIMLNAFTFIFSCNP